MRILFFFMGLPMIFMSFFETVDVLPYVSNTSLFVNGNEIVLSEEDQVSLEQQINSLFENSRTMPAFGVVTQEMYQQEVSTGYCVSMKFDKVLDVNGLPFDELVFKIERDFSGFNLMRGMRGVFQGRCIYIDLQDRTMAELYDFVESLDVVKNIQTPIPDYKAPETEQEVPEIEIPEVEEAPEEEVTQVKGEKLLEENFIQSSKI